MSKEVVVVGGGVSGLLSAYYLTKNGHRVTLIEKSNQLGGLIGSERIGSGLVESAANGLINSDLVEDLFKDVGVDLVPALREARNRYFFRKILRKFPLSWGESNKLIWHFGPRAIFWKRGLRPPHGESVLDWGQKHLGFEATRYFLAPALQGIYAGRVDKMSATLLYERFFGPKLRKPARRVKNKGLVAPRNGMGELVEKLTAYLKNADVRFRMNESFDYDKHAKSGESVVICTRADLTADIIKPRFPQVADRLAKVEMLPLTSVTVFFPDDSKLPKGFGCLIPRGEGFQALGVLFNGYIFPERVASGDVRAETWIFGGAHKKNVTAWPDEYLLSRIQVERIKLFSQRVEPLEWRIHRWTHAIPHYNMDLEIALREIQPLPQGLHLVGNYLGGIGLSQIIEQAHKVAAEV